MKKPKDKIKHFKAQIDLWLDYYNIYKALTEMFGDERYKDGAQSCLEEVKYWRDKLYEGN